jgi:hypothetical protein
MVGRYLVFFLCLVLLTPTVSAQENPEYDKFMAAGKTFVDKQDYAKALGQFTKAHRHKPSSKGVVFNIGYCLMRLTRLDESIARFEAYIGMNPGTAKIQKARMFINQMKEDLSQTQGRVTVETEPPGARVLLDGKEPASGTMTPVVLWAPAGQRVLDITMPGFQKVTKTFTAVAGKDSTMSFTLVRAVPKDPITPPEGPSGKVTAKRSPAPWVLLGIGIGVAAGGGALYFVARDKFIQANKDPESPTFDTDWESATTLAYAGYGLLGVGGATAVSGLIWGLARGGKKAPEKAAFGLTPLPGGAVGGVTLTW